MRFRGRWLHKSQLQTSPFGTYVPFEVHPFGRTAISCAFVSLEGPFSASCNSSKVAQLSLFPPQPALRRSATEHNVQRELIQFSEFGTTTRLEWLGATPLFRNEFWTARQRAASSLHEISYRACFKPALPRFFIERLSKPGDLVYDPFMGRGTTCLEAALLGRVPAGTDVNPLSGLLTRPRLQPPTTEEVEERCKALRELPGQDGPDELLTFYHPDTLRELCALRSYLASRGDLEDHVDRWIRMVACNRLTGHSVGFFSVYTLPPNQAVSVEAQKKINARRNQTPPRRAVYDLIERKSRSLLADCDSGVRARLARAAGEARLATGSCADTPWLADGSVSLVVTSPPFLDVVDYRADNWLRCWFCSIETANVELKSHAQPRAWQGAMQLCLQEVARALKPGGFVAFEVGEVRKGSVKLEELVLPAARAAGLHPLLVLINQQVFTKTANCWGVDNGVGGTNSNRVVLLTRD